MTETTSYGRRAIAAHPGYVTPSAPCDVPDCGRSVAGSRTITFIPRERADGPMSLLIRLCAGHMPVPHGELVTLLPYLAKIEDAAGPIPWITVPGQGTT